MPRIAPFRRISAAQLQQLEERMQAYNAAVPDYPAFWPLLNTRWSGDRCWRKS
jgi:hypothetical protein